MGTRPIYYDTETTGIKPDTDRIVEIAAYDPVQNRTFEQVVNPGIPIPLEASAIHNITDAMVADAPNFSVVGKKFVEFCEGDVVLIAHNNDGFDIHFLKNEFLRHHIEFPPWTFLDTLRWARRYRPDLPRHTLQFLREIYGIPANQAHRALDDVIVLYKVFSIMIDDLDIQDVLKLLKGPKEITLMPFGKHQGRPLAEVPKDYVQWLKKSGCFDKPENAQLKQSLEKLDLL